MTISFQHTLKSGITVNITATVCDRTVVDYSATSMVSRNGVEREVLFAERGGRLDREFVPVISKRISECAVEDCDDDEAELDWEAEQAFA